jgi:hypothetical protein
MQVATRLGERRIVCCEYSENRMEKQPVLTACAGSDIALGRRDCKAARLLSTQIVSNTRRKLFSSATAQNMICNVIVNAFQQYEQLPSVATAKMKRRTTGFNLAHPPFFANAHDCWGFKINTC